MPEFLDLHIIQQILARIMQEHREADARRPRRRQDELRKCVPLLHTLLSANAAPLIFRHRLAGPIAEDHPRARRDGRFASRSGVRIIRGSLLERRGIVPMRDRHPVGGARMGNDTTATWCAANGNLNLNVMMPAMKRTRPFRPTGLCGTGYGN